MFIHKFNPLSWGYLEIATSYRWPLSRDEMKGTARPVKYTLHPTCGLFTQNAYCFNTPFFACLSAKPRYVTPVASNSTFVPFSQRYMSIARLYQAKFLLQHFFPRSYRKLLRWPSLKTIFWVCSCCSTLWCCSQIAVWWDFDLHVKHFRLLIHFRIACPLDKHL